MTTERATVKRTLEETTVFAERALLDFELTDAFYARSKAEREGCLRWIDAACGEPAKDECVSEMLDCLAFGRPLPVLHAAGCPLQLPR